MAETVDQCPICYDDILEPKKDDSGRDDPLLALPACGHILHKSCCDAIITASTKPVTADDLLRGITKKPPVQCPMCRQPFSRREVVKLHISLPSKLGAVPSGAGAGSSDVGSVNDVSTLRAMVQQAAAATRRVEQRLSQAEADKTKLEQQLQQENAERMAVIQTAEDLKRHLKECKALLDVEKQERSKLKVRVDDLQPRAEWALAELHKWNERAAVTAYITDGDLSKLQEKARKHARDAGTSGYETIVAGMNRRIQQLEMDLARCLESESSAVAEHSKLIRSKQKVESELNTMAKTAEGLLKQHKIIEASLAQQTAKADTYRNQLLQLGVTPASFSSAASSKAGVSKGQMSSSGGHPAHASNGNGGKGSAAFSSSAISEFKRVQERLQSGQLQQQQQQTHDREDDHDHDHDGDNIGARGSREGPPSSRPAAATTATAQSSATAARRTAPLLAASSRGPAFVVPVSQRRDASSSHRGSSNYKYPAAGDNDDDDERDMDEILAILDEHIGTGAGPRDGHNSNTHRGNDGGAASDLGTSQQHNGASTNAASAASSLRSAAPSSSSSSSMVFHRKDQQPAQQQRPSNSNGGGAGAATAASAASAVPAQVPSASAGATRGRHAGLDDSDNNVIVLDDDDSEGSRGGEARGAEMDGDSYGGGDDDGNGDGDGDGDVQPGDSSATGNRSGLSSAGAGIVSAAAFVQRPIASFCIPGRAPFGQAAPPPIPGMHRPVAALVVPASGGSSSSSARLSRFCVPGTVGSAIGAAAAAGAGSASNSSAAPGDKRKALAPAPMSTVNRQPQPQPSKRPKTDGGGTGGGVGKQVSIMAAFGRSQQQQPPAAIASKGGQPTVIITNLDEDDGGDT